MPRSLEPQPVAFKRVFFDLPADLAEQLKIHAVQERKYMRNLLSDIVQSYLENIYGKKKK